MLRHSGILFLLAAAVAARADDGGEVRIDGALLTLIEQTDVPARDSGVLTSIGVQEGQSVAVDQVVANVDDADARLLLVKAQAEASIAESAAKNDVDVRFARKAAEVAQAELRRSKESIERFERSISQTELDKITLEAERATLAVESAERELQAARLTLALKQAEVAVAQQVVERRIVRAPLKGLVVQIHRRRGEWVKPGEPVVRLMRIDRLRVEAFVAAGASPPAAGGRATFELPQVTGEPRRFPGKLEFVSPEVDPVNGQIRIWAEIENEGQMLRPGQRGTLRFAPAAGAAVGPVGQAGN
jgi:multidrug efflux pump subunit AcrA (membrane-fusion protein)